MQYGKCKRIKKRLNKKKRIFFIRAGNRIQSLNEEDTKNYIKKHGVH